MKPTTTLFFLGLLMTAMPLPAQRFPTNSVNAAQAVKLASGLRAGMSEQDVARVLGEQNGLKSGGALGDSFGWSRFYLLADGCFLDLEMDAKEVRNDGTWGGNGLLRSASIQSNQVKIISITLTNALETRPVDGSRAIRSETNSSSVHWPVPPGLPTFGSPSEKSIRVVIFGTVYEMKAGYYYLPKGATVRDAMGAAHVSRGGTYWRFSGVERPRPDGSFEVIHFTATSDRRADLQMVLQVGDRLYFAHEVY